VAEKRAEFVDRVRMLLPPTDLHGAFRRNDLIERCGRRWLITALRTRLLSPLWTGVVVDSARLLDVRTRGAAAQLLAGPAAVLCGPTAAYLHGCRSLDTAVTHLLLPYGRCPRNRAGLQVHHSCFFAEHTVQLDGLNVLALDHVLADLLCCARPADALAVTDEALRLANGRSDELRRAVARRLRSRPAPRGTVHGAGLLDLATPKAESPAESWIRLTIIERGLPLPEANFPIRNLDGDELYRIDLAWPQLRIALEYDGYAAHAGRERSDAGRLEDLRRRGWIVVRAEAEDLADPTRLIAELTAAFARRGYTW
jgi:hypothetical protein